MVLAEDWSWSTFRQPLGTVRLPARSGRMLVQTCCLKTHRYGGHLRYRSRIPWEWLPTTSSPNQDFMQELHASLTSGV
jgi:hypothetical protein